MKTKEELEFLREEIDALSTKLAELTEDELKEVTGGELPQQFSDWKKITGNMFSNGVVLAAVLSDGKVPGSAGIVQSAKPLDTEKLC